MKDVPIKGVQSELTIDVGEKDIMKALREVTKKWFVHDGLMCGLDECDKPLDCGKA